jgi:hypothetical protein
MLLEQFDAADDLEARGCARGLAAQYRGIREPITGRLLEFTAERREADRWVPVTAWVPRPRTPDDGPTSRAGIHPTL